ncbi:MAG: carboxylesterase family protein [Eubacteriales bacterium]|nr:carboxylesterase family protein [Eubacteriales bacterium]
MAMRETTVENGRLRGTASGIPSVTVFKGVPYAKPPLGTLRWREPQPCENWDGIYDATYFRAMAAQPDDKSELDKKEFCGFGSHESNGEDCLYVNIWTPAQSPEERLPVVFYIHGGGFYQGYSYDITVSGDAFARHGCILVSVEYRVGILGFLAHPEMTQENPHRASGNFGLLDQTAALQWVHRNITAFGGDPNNVTVFGQSAGAYSTMAQLCTPLTDGLISKVMMESGGGYGGKRVELLPVLHLSEAENLGRQIFGELGVDTLEQARTVPVERILEVQHQYGMIFVPIVDGYFYPMHPDDIVMQQKHHNIPVMIGYCGDESAWFRETVTQEDGKHFADAARHRYGAYAEKYLCACGYEKDPIAAAGNRMHDGMTAPALAYCELSTSWENRTPPYLYYFDRKIPGDHYGAFHAGDLWYVFHTLHRSWRPFTGADYELAEVFHTYLCNFAKTGNPNGPGLSEWRPYSAVNRAAMELGIQRGMIPYPGQASSKVLVDLILNR